MNTLQTTPHNMPIDHDQMRDETRMSWLQMAQVNFPGNPICVPAIPHADPYLRRAIDIGQLLAVELRSMSTERGELLVDTAIKARCLRLYLAAVEGELDHVSSVGHAEQIVGIRNDGNSLKGEWK